MRHNAKRNYIFYVLMLAFFGVLVFWIISRGNLYDSTAVAAHSESMDFHSSLLHFGDSLGHSMGHPLALLFLQIIAILIAVRFFSFLFKYLGQPGVIGEIVAGIALGPSVLGYFFPEVFSFLFSPESLEPLNIISQIGLILFMFVIGMELDLSIVKKKASETLVISHASIILPFFLGLVLAYYVYPEFGAGHTSFLSFSLFVGISVSITAFPVLARIIQERNLTKTPMGMLAIASAANNDITAWCLLAAIIAIAQAGSAASALYTLALSALYILFMFGLVRPFMRKLGELYNNPEVINKTFVSFIFLVLILSSCITEILGIHALFGAFLAGVIMPANVSFRRIMTEKVEDVALVLFLPLFFVFTGLRTEIGLLNTPYLWGMCAVFVAVSIVGKLLGASLSARFVGESWKDSLSIGVLMNTRGLMELIVLNIGYEMGIIPSSIFVIFVIMALFTTFMATPMLVLIEKAFHKKRRIRKNTSLLYPKVLISFGNPRSGRIFLNVVNLLCGRYIGKTKLTAIHYTIGTDTSVMNAMEFSAESFSELNKEASRLGIKVDTRYRVTDHYTKDLAELVRDENYDFVLVGAGPNFVSDYMQSGGKPLLFETEFKRINKLLHQTKWSFPGELTRDKSKTLFQSLRCTLGVFVNRNFTGGNRVGVLVSDYNPRLLQLVETIATATHVELMSTDKEHLSKLREDVQASGRPEDLNITVCGPDCTLQTFVKDKDLVLLSFESWTYLLRHERMLVHKLPSFLVFKPGETMETEY